MMERPRVPGWVRWVMERLMSERDRRVALSELEELHETWVRERGRREADRRYLRQLRQYPLRLLWERLPAPGRGAGAWMGGSAVRQAARSLGRSPGLSLSIVLTVGLGIGGCTVVFAVVDALYLRPLAYPDAERLAWIYTDHPPNQFPFSVADYQALHEQQSAFAGVGAYRTATGTLLTGDEPERIAYLAPTPGFFDVLGISPLSGRLPSEEEGVDGAPPTTLATLGFVRRRTGSARPDGADALGSTVDVDGVPYQVIGVLPDDLGPLVRSSEVFPTLRLAPPPRRGPFFLRVVGRLRPDVSRDVAGEELRQLNRELLPVWIDSYREARSTWGLRPVDEVLRGDSGRLVGLLVGAVIVLLFIAVVNASGLLLARLGARRRELAVRSALGATGSHLSGHMLVESALLALVGVAVGVGMAALVLGALPTVAGGYLPRLDEVRLGGTVLAFTGLLAGGCALLFTAVPVVAGASGLGLGGGVARAGRSGQGTQRGQRALVMGQIAVTLPLLTAAGLLLTSFARLQNVEPGFEPDGLLTARVSVSRARHPEPGARLALWRRLEESLAGIPGVSAVGLAGARPPATYGDTNNFDLEDDPTPPGENQPVANWVIADRGYFGALGVPLLEGRLLGPEDEDSGAPVVVVDQAWAERWFPGESAVGRRLHEGGSPGWTTVVGVVGEVPYHGPGVATGGTVYAPWLPGLTEPYVALRVAGDPASATRAVVEEVRRLDPTAPVTGVRTGDDLLSDALAEPRHLAVILVSFAAVALLLAVVGLYGVTAQRVQRRRADIALRLALGGRRGSVLGRVLRDGLALAVAGLAIGVALTVPATRGLEGLLYDIAPFDLFTVSAAALLLAAVATVATLVPAWRVLGVDPASTLRQE